MKMPESLLLGDDGDVIPMGVRDQFGGFSGGERAAWRSREGMVGIEERVLKVGRVNVDLERGERCV